MPKTLSLSDLWFNCAWPAIKTATRFSHILLTVIYCFMTNQISTTAVSRVTCLVQFVSKERRLITGNRLKFLHEGNNPLLKKLINTVIQHSRENTCVDDQLNFFILNNSQTFNNYNNYY